MNSDKTQKKEPE